MIHRINDVVGKIMYYNKYMSCILHQRYLQSREFGTDQPSDLFS